MSRQPLPDHLRFVRVNITLDRATLDALDALVADGNRSRSEAIRNAVAAYAKEIRHGKTYA